MASISHRYSIRWLPDSASEPTSTLVLTLESGFYIDVRVKIERSEGPPPCLPVSKDPLLSPPTTPAAQEQIASSNDSERSNPLDSWRLQIDWAFAGQSTSTNGPPRECTWQHWVDSKTSLMTEKPFEDAGSMYPRDDGMTLEKGAMVNPETGKETEYEEIWEDPAVTYPGSLQHEYYVLALDEVNGEGKDRARGVIVQLGPWYQVVYRRDRYDEDDNLVTEFHTARWKFDVAESKWKLIVGLGRSTYAVPGPSETEAELKAGLVGSGASLELNGQKWTCKEMRTRERSSS